MFPGNPAPKRMRTDRHNNPTAFTTDVARNGGLVEGVDYEQGDSFKVGVKTLYTARLLKDPIDTTIRLIDKATYYTKSGLPRWSYMSIPPEIWDALTYAQKKLAIKVHYAKEGGTELKKLFL